MGVLVVVGGAGHISTSVDHGATWTVRTPVTSKQLLAIASKPDATQAVAVGDQGAICTSTDQGATWVLRTGPNVLDYLTGVAWNGTRWVAVGYNFGGPGSYTVAVSWTSTDGITWTTGTIASPGFGSNAQTSSVVNFGGTFYAVVQGGFNGTVAPAGVYTSTNGTSWTRNNGFSTVAPSLNPYTFADAYIPFCIASNGSRLMVGTQLGSNNLNFFTSVDGVSWAAAGGYGAMFSRSVAGAPSGGWVAVGFYGDARSLATPNDSWGSVGPVNPGAAPGTQLLSICWEGTVYAAGSTDAGNVFTSATGSSWTLRSTGGDANLGSGIGVIPNSPPTAALLVSPANNAAVDFTQTTTWVEQFQDPDMPLDSQKRVAIKFQRTAPTSGTAMWWDGAAMQASETYITQSSGTISIPGNMIGTNGETYSWSVITKDQLDTAGVYSATRSVVGSLPPVVTATGPAGTITNTTTPSPTWTYSDPEATAQESYRVKIFNATQYGAGGFDPETSTADYDSGQVFSATTSPGPINKDLTNLVSYRTYVKVTQIGAQASAWAFIASALNITLPATPSLTVQTDTTNARIKLIAAGTITPYSSASYRFEYHDGDGNWKSVLNGTVAVPAGLTYTVWDYLAHPGKPRYYRVSTVSALSSTTQVASSYSGVQVVTLTITNWWLKHKTLPALNMAIAVQQPFQPKRKIATTTFEPVGSNVDVVLSDGPKGTNGTLTVMTFGEAQNASLDALMLSDATLLLQDPFGHQWWIRVNGDVAMPLTSGVAQQRVWSIPYTEVAEPLS